MVNCTLDNRIALVTGGSRGIGRCLAERLASEGVKVILAARSQEALDRTVNHIKGQGGEAAGIVCDFADPKQVQDLAEKSVAVWGGLDILINNAGTSINKLFYETGNDEWMQMQMVNAMAPFILCRDCLPALKESKAASIINIGSVVGIKGYENQAAYTASKHALMGFTKVLAQEVQPFGIRVHAINPGGVDTEMVRQMRPDLDTSGLIKPDDIADLVIYLLTHRTNAMLDDLHIRRANGSPWY